MLLPEFKLNQNQKYITVSIRVPYVKITACQFYIDSYSFKFYLKPYLLNLTFQQQLKEAQQPAKAVYYHQKHILEVQLQKKTLGQCFQNLNLLSNVISTKTNKKTKDKRVLVQVVSQKSAVQSTNQQNENQNPYSYGFCGNYYGVFKDLSQQCTQLFMFDPSSVSKIQRYELSRKIVEEAFDQNAYMYDKISNFEEIDRILEGKWYHQLVEKVATLKKQPFTHQKFKAIAKIPKKQILVDIKSEENILKQIISLCFSYVYEYACMEGQLSVESPKTINLTSAVLSCQITYQNLSFQQLVYDCCRRCITYSLYKHLEICQKVCSVLHHILCKDFIVEALLQIRVSFQKSDPRYLLNRIFIDDYLTYVMNKPIEQQLQKICKQFQILSQNLSEDKLDLDLQEQQMENNLVQSICVQNQLENLLNLD